MLTLAAVDPMLPHLGFNQLFPRPAALPLAPLLSLPLNPLAAAVNLLPAAFAGGQPAPLAGWLGPTLRLVPSDVDQLASGNSQLPGTQSVLVPQSTTDPDVQAANNFVQDAVGGVIRRLHEYLQTNVRQYAPLSDAIPLVQRAAELYEARDYPRACAQAYQAYRAIGIIRTRIPDLPST